MSILIKGMEMPKTCGECRFSVDGWCYAIASNDDQPGYIKPYEKAKWCPLVPVPPHGRLIDADALLADVRAHSESYFADDFAHEWVDVAPTVIETESYSERELQRDYEASVEYAQHLERYEPTYDPDTGAM